MRLKPSRTDRFPICWYLSKLLERLAVRQLLDHLTALKLLPDLQSAYRAYYSMQMAVLKIHGDILHAVDHGDLAALALLDLPAAFDTVDHASLMRRLWVSYGLGGRVIDWFEAYQSRSCRAAVEPNSFDVVASVQL